jgi:uncharacterized protein (TIGR00299 family) protein
MLVGGILDLGWPISEVEALVSRMGLEGVEVAAARVEHQGLTAKRLAVEVKSSQPHRHLSHVRQILGRLEPALAEPALRVFERLAAAEARVHGTTVEKIHFHEVGAADALVDVAAFCAGLAWLAVDQVICSPLPLGRGFVQCAHGRLPLPAPAVLNLLDDVPIRDWPEQEETVTPTGAALVSTLATKFGDIPTMHLEATGIGGGTRSSTHAPNLVRLMLGRLGQEYDADQVVEIVCHLDDQSPEDLPLIYERLLQKGALDVAAASLLMKKGRPGLELVVLSPPDLAESLASLVLEQTTTLGVRLRRVERRLLQREVVILDTPWGPVRVKHSQAAGVVNLHPEADDVASICRRTGLSPTQVRAEIVRMSLNQAK